MNYFYWRKHDYHHNFILKRNSMETCNYMPGWSKVDKVEFYFWSTTHENINIRKIFNSHSGLNQICVYI